MPLITQELDATKLAEARRRAGMSQTELAKAVGVTATTVRHYEHERRVTPRADVLVRMAETLGTKPSELLKPANA
jgi:transcriptional regulator with XRE-family HTH domain